MTDWKTIEDRLVGWAEKHQTPIFLVSFFVVFLLTLRGC